MKSHSEDKLESLKEMFASNLLKLADISYEEASVLYEDHFSSLLSEHHMKTQLTLLSKSTCKRK